MNIKDIEKEIGVMQLSDSFFPTGIFATSNGLEYLFSKNEVKTTADLLKMIQVSVAQQLGPTDCVALADVHDSASKNDFSRILEADRIIYATKPIKEIRSASIRSGIQLIKCVAGFTKDEILNQYQTDILQNKAHGVFPVAFAICCNALGIKKEKSMVMLLYGFTVSVVGAALRLGLIQHFESQKIIHDTKPIISKVIKEFSEKSIFEMWQFAPQMDIVQMSHEKMDSKMFIT